MKHHGTYIEVTLEVKKKPASSWLDKGGVWEGRALIPTLTRALPSLKPFSKPAGIAQASDKAIERWRADNHCFQVYNYEDNHMIWDTTKDQYRLPSAEECEQLMGIGKFYTVGAVKEHFDSRATFVTRRQLIGNSFNCCVVSYLIGDLLTSFCHMPSVPLETHLEMHTYDPPFNEIFNSSQVLGTSGRETEMVREYLRIAEKGGSDVRLELGVPFRAAAWPRAGARTHQWVWEIVHGYPWRTSENVHINKLELLAAFNCLKWRTRSHKQQGSRFIHLVDSQVVGAILTKGRSSSRLLRSTVRRVNALVLAGNIYPAYAFVASEDNPADLPSRWQYVAKLRRKGPYQSKPAKISVKRKAR
jgi:hypothetical protein